MESNHISEETSEETTVAAVAEEMSKLLIEDAETKAAIENGNGSASSSATASKSSSQIKQKLKYAEHYADGKFDGGEKTQLENLQWARKFKRKLVKSNK